MSSASENVEIGTSGWSYKEWEGIFYPDSKTSKLKHYSRVFSTAEVDSTFYAVPTKGLVFGWAKNTQENFEFSLKLPRTITHEKKLKLGEGAEIDLKNFLALLEPLRVARKLGPLLIQLPPSFNREANREDLEEFLRALPTKKKDGDYKFAIEFRNKSWLSDNDLHSLLSKYNVSNAIVDEPLMPVDLSVTSREFAFLRWHGRGKRPWYDYRYSEEELDPWVERVRKISTKTRKVYGYFNNHFHGNAVVNGLEFLEKLGTATSVQKETLKEIEERRAQKQMTL